MPKARPRKPAPKPAAKSTSKLSHVGKDSRARMVDVTDKADELRSAAGLGEREAAPAGA